MVSEEDRFRQAFQEALDERPDYPPGPTILRKKMGLRPHDNLNGRLSRLRIHLLRDAGFKKSPFSERWYKP